MSSTTFSNTFQPTAPEDEEGTNCMEETGEVSMRCLITIPNTQCFTIQQGKKNCLGTGNLQCLTTDNDTLLLYIPNIFHYATNKSFPALKASQYSFVFPGVNHICFGVMFPNDTKLEDIQIFEGLLMQYSQYQIQNEANNNLIVDNNNNNNNNKSNVKTILTDMKLDVSDENIEKTGKKISENIKKGTEIASKGIQKGTIFAASGIKKAKNYLKSKMNVQENKPVDPKTFEYIQKAKIASKTAVTVSKAVVIGAYSACNALASNLADAAAQTSFGQSVMNNKSVKMEIAKDITKNTIAGAFIIYEELQNAAIVLVSEIADASADVVEHRYGEQMGTAAKQTAGIVKDSAQLIKNVTDVGLAPLTANIVGTTIVDTISTDEEKMKQKQIEHNMNSTSEVKTAAMLATATSTTVATNSSLIKKD